MDPTLDLQGLRLVHDRPTRQQFLLNAQTEALTETIGRAKGGGTLEAVQTRIGIPVLVPTQSAQWVVFEVLARGTHLWDLEPYARGGIAWNKMTVEGAAMVPDDKAIKCFFVGWTMGQLQPVFAHRPSATRNPSGTRSRRANREPPPLEDGWKGIDFKNVNSARIGNGAILHHSIAVQDNMRHIKAVLAMKTDEEALEREFSNSDYDFQDGLLGETLAQLSAQNCADLNAGIAPQPFAFIAPVLSTQLAINANLDSLTLPNAPEGPRNRILRDRLPTAAPYLRRGHNEPASFIYQAPCMSNMAYPDELYDELRAFARKHTGDKLNATALLFATQLWVDIVEDEDFQIEPLFRAKNNPVPFVPLAVFLLYFEHWVKVHSLFGLLEFGHPFRVTSQMYRTDVAHDANAFHINPEDIDERQIRTLVAQAAAIEPNIPASTRVGLFPFLLSSSPVLPPQDIEGFVLPNRVTMALIGFPSIWILGLPSTHRQPNSRRLIAAPKIIADLSFHGIQTKLLNRFVVGLRDVGEPGVTSIMGESSRYGTIWANRFHPDEDNNTAIRLRGRAFGVPELPAGPLSSHMGFNMARLHARRMNIRILYLQRLAVNIDDVRVGNDGLPYVPGMPFEDEEFLITAIAGLAVHAVVQPAAEGLLQVEPEEPQPPAPEPPAPVPAETMAGLLNALEQRPRVIHRAWGAAFRELTEMMNAPEARHTPSAVFQVLDRARTAHSTDLDVMEQLQVAVSEGQLMEVNAHIWAPQFLCRLCGVDTGVLPDENEWDQSLSARIRAHDYLSWGNVGHARECLRELRSAQWAMRGEDSGLQQPVVDGRTAEQNREYWKQNTLKIMGEWPMQVEHRPENFLRDQIQEIEALMGPAQNNGNGA